MDMLMVAGGVVVLLMIALGLFLLVRPATRAYRPDEEPPLLSEASGQPPAGESQRFSDCPTTIEHPEELPAPAHREPDVRAYDELLATPPYPESRHSETRGVAAPHLAAKSPLDEHVDQLRQQDEASVLAQAQRVIAVHLLPRQSDCFLGEQLFDRFRTYGLRFGDMSLFHRFEDSDGQGALMFSALRLTDEQPSAFDLETLPTDVVQGVSFFLALPGPAPDQGYATMISIAQRMAHDLGAYLVDEQFHLFSSDLKEHYRKEVLAFQNAQAVALTN